MANEKFVIDIIQCNFAVVCLRIIVLCNGVASLSKIIVGISRFDLRSHERSALVKLIGWFDKGVYLRFCSDLY